MWLILLTQTVLLIATLLIIKKKLLSIHSQAKLEAEVYINEALRLSSKTLLLQKDALLEHLHILAEAAKLDAERTKSELEQIKKEATNSLILNQEEFHVKHLKQVTTECSVVLSRLEHDKNILINQINDSLTEFTARAEQIQAVVETNMKSAKDSAIIQLNDLGEEKRKLLDLQADRLQTRLFELFPPETKGVWLDSRKPGVYSNKPDAQV